MYWLKLFILDTNDVDEVCSHYQELAEVTVKHLSVVMLVMCSLVGACGKSESLEIDSDDPRLDNSLPYEKDSLGPSVKEQGDSVTPGTKGQPTGSSEAGSDNSNSQKEPSKDKGTPTSTAPNKDATAEGACYQECLKNNQARAVAWDMVERDCKASCDGTAPNLEVK